MVVVIIQGLGLLFFVVSTAVLGGRLRRVASTGGLTSVGGLTPAGAKPSEGTIPSTGANLPGERAAELSILAQMFFYTMLFSPAMLGVFYPGLPRFDALVGLPPLPYRPYAFIVGALMLGPGLYITSVSSKALIHFGKGYRAFRLTKHLVEGGMYRRVRNPMALGFYLTCVGIGLMVGSTYAVLVSIFLLVPAHIFYLLYFEELELALRLGPEYLRYKGRVPFLIPALFGSKEIQSSKGV